MTCTLCFGGCRLLLVWYYRINFNFKLKSTFIMSQSYMKTNPLEKCTTMIALKTLFYIVPNFLNLVNRLHGGNLASVLKI
ncbi:hypothetical protein L1887_23686 [Cichorium endivia]|nr:hypothetical protein L1887_23686 [Cichorium endivia]